MNIFILDESPILAARAQHDRHVIKMSLEACQMLSVACRIDGPIRDAFLASGIPQKDQIEKFSLLGSLAPTVFDDSSLYALTHQNHPASIWTRAHPANFIWLTIHLDALMAESHRRWPGKIRKCDSLRFYFGALAASLSGLPHPTKPHRSSCGFYTRESDGPVAVNQRLVSHCITHHTPLVYCGPENYKQASIVDSYRNYYLHEKLPNNRWTQPSYMPDWLAPHAKIHIPPTQNVRKTRQPKVRKPFMIPPTHTQTPKAAAFLQRIAIKS